MACEVSPVAMFLMKMLMATDGSPNIHLHMSRFVTSLSTFLLRSASTNCTIAQTEAETMQTKLQLSVEMTTERILKSKVKESDKKSI